jgi:hypothetical protein
VSRATVTTTTTTTTTTIIATAKAKATILVIVEGTIRQYEYVKINVRAFWQGEKVMW